MGERQTRSRYANPSKWRTAGITCYQCCAGHILDTKKPLLSILWLLCLMLDTFICPLILLLKNMLNKCYSATLVDEETRAQKDLQIYLWPHSWRISESECKSRNVQFQKPSMFTIVLAFWSYKKHKGSTNSNLSILQGFLSLRWISLNSKKLRGRFTL